MPVASMVTREAQHAGTRGLSVRKHDARQAGRQRLRDLSRSGARLLGRDADGDDVRVRRPQLICEQQKT